MTKILPVIEKIPAEELALRHARCRDILNRFMPEASGMLVFSRIQLYYLTGTLANGIFWLPKEGKPVLMARHGIERCRLESAIEEIHPFRSFSDIESIVSNAGSPLLPAEAADVAVDFAGLTWQLGDLLRKKLPHLSFIPCDRVLTAARSVKTEWELKKLRLSGARHHKALYHDLPRKLHIGMTERDVAHRSWEIFFAKGHCGMLRMNTFGEDIFLGHIAAGESGNYPSHFNGPLGLMGEHPATPFMGYSGKVWRSKSPLTVDIGFALEGYHTDKTQVYWAGSRSSIPDIVRNAHDTCIEIQQTLAAELRVGSTPSLLYKKALSMAERAGFEDGFMGLGNNKVKFVGHGIGLGIDEHPVIATGFDAPLEKGNVIALEPKIGIQGIGMVGVENTFEITDNASTCLTGDSFEMICIE
ncbi:M24 family metallopeptidase [Halodesulfovibrio sp.]|jgi:Xaa-Pro dipeptidase|uniref:M24 family metallopeptidase n=1 Tax=Halodesulfovibrio sp. TaxID=1912772 RepID=UPI0025F1FF53|nr:M24 family metallopeptidase [Halodesulfovibrio sp.]MCT4626777.1 M24 family metallopeptidase [Halodesulfovibrio sp.]